MNDKSSKSPRQLFIEFLTLNQLSKRTIQAYVYWIADLARFHNRAPALLVDDDIRAWLFHLIEQRKHPASSASLAINSIRAFFGRHLGRDMEPLFKTIVRAANRRSCFAWVGLIDRTPTAASSNRRNKSGGHPFTTIPPQLRPTYSAHLLEFACHTPQRKK